VEGGGPTTRRRRAPFLSFSGGDDEESWAGGLTASTFWAHKDALLAAGPVGWAAAAAPLVCAARGGGGKRPPPAPAPPPTGSADVSFVCGTRLAVGGPGAFPNAAPPASFAHLGPAPHACSAAAAAAGRYLHAPVRGHGKHDLLAALSAVVGFAGGRLAAGDAVVLSSGPGPCGGAAGAAAAAVLAACYSDPPDCTFVAPFGAARRPCGCPAPPPLPRSAVRARLAAVADAAPSRSPSKDAAKAVLQWVAPVPGRRCVDCGERGG